MKPQFALFIKWFVLLYSILCSMIMNLHAQRSSIQGDWMFAMKDSTLDIEEIVQHIHLKLKVGLFRKKVYDASNKKFYTLRE